jgi:3-methyladenine DNA glycosylase AlkD
VAREFRSLSLKDVEELLASKWHEERLLALVILVNQYARASDAEREAIYRLYLASTARINNWDLVDVSAAQIVGAHVFDRDRRVLYRLAKSRNVWERRIAIIATARFIRSGQFDDTFAIVESVLDDEHDLIHKAAGWMLREIGKRNRPAEERFLRKHAPRMPRTMLRYAIERFPRAIRQRYLAA